MGADSFFTVAQGKNAKEAFRRAKENAQYEYGHRGYTGTIAEKDTFVMMSEKALPEREANTLADKLLDHPKVVDKWGPAGCIPLDNGNYLFFGWASS